MGKMIDITNQRFGQLVAIKPAERHKANGDVMWICRCSCGRYLIVSGPVLRAGKSTKCSLCAKHGDRSRWAEKVILNDGRCLE